MNLPEIARLEAALTYTQREALRLMRADAEPGQPDMAEEELAESCALVDFHVSGRTVPQSVLAGWAIDIASYKLAMRLGEMNDQVANQKGLWEAAMTALRSVRDDKFSQAAPVATQDGSGIVMGGTRPNIFSH